MSKFKVRFLMRNAAVKLIILAAFGVAAVPAQAARDVTPPAGSVTSSDGKSTSNKFQFGPLFDVLVAQGVANFVPVEKRKNGNNPVSGQPVFAQVPEPSTWAMLILGLGMVGTMLRRRKTAAQVVLGSL